MKQTSLALGCGGRRIQKEVAAVGSGPKTKMPFLLNIVKKYKNSEDSLSFQPYPILQPGMAKQAGSALLYKDKHCILVNDAFPKSFVHCLIMPQDTSLLSLNDLNASHLELVLHMKQVADDYVAFLKKSLPTVYKNRRFISGFHSLPSLPMLHMHLLTLDLDSPCLKNKKHYNSFATFFFLSSERVIEDLTTHHRITLNQDVKQLHQLEEQSMCCLWCGEPLANVPAMKQHIRACKENKSMTTETK
ncbi:aprataxin [Angomonas deanei]|nr:aprataxin [Angomonas deanei]|eukprot:EPY25846.1 aprataxin [Angomonas deanei]